MSRLITTFAMGLAAIATLNAGQIQVGSGTNGANGLTAYNTTTGVGYMNSTTAAGAGNTSCIGATLAYNPGFAGCAKAQTGNGEKDYATLLFEGASGGGFVAPSGTSLTDTNGVKFARVADSGKDFWAAQQSTGTTGDVIVAVGVYGVQNVYTMLNDYWGANGQQDVSVIFTWSATSSAGLTGAYTTTTNLVNGTDIRSAVNCATPASCKTNGATAGFTGETGELQIATTAPNTASVYSTSYSTIASISGYNGYTAPGTIHLDSQTFSFGNTHLNEYLVSITIRDTLSAAYGSTNPVGNSRAALSAITFDQATPEPGTILLSLTGLAALGYFRKRRNA